MERGRGGKKEGGKKAVGFLLPMGWKDFFFRFPSILLCVCAHPCFAKNSAALTHLVSGKRLLGAFKRSCYY